eukprot:maker-scaffold_3-snap-gene-21.1-mRNA-1 protein AED:0.05 eAED:0.50 QI:0/0/0.5/1/0/0/2/178/325
MFKKLASLFALTSTLRSSLAARCFDSCFSIEAGSCSEQGVCADRCGQSLSGAQNNFPQAFPGFVVDECENECLWGEFSFTRSNGNSFTLAFPFGCKEKYSPERISNNILSNIQFSDGVNLFSCEDNFCNQPPEQTECGEEEAIEYTQNFDNLSPCFINNSEFTPLRSNPFRVVLPSGLVRANVETSGCDVDIDEFEAEEILPEENGDSDPLDEDNLLVGVLVALVTVLSLVILIFFYKRSEEKQKLRKQVEGQLESAEVVSDQEKSASDVPIAAEVPIWPVEETPSRNVIDELDNLEVREDVESLDRQRIESEKKSEVDLDLHSL